MKTRKFDMSTIDPRDPRTIDRLIAFHRRTFGDAQMNGNGGKSGDEQNPAPGSEGASGTDDHQTQYVDPDTGKPYAFPAETPTAQMTDAQRAEYWKYHSRKHEGVATSRADYDEQKQLAEKWRAAQRENLPADQRALEDAKDAARTEGRQAADALWASKVVAAEVRAALTGAGTPPAKVQSLVGFLDHSKFLTESGEVDPVKIQAFVAGNGGSATGRWPDMGAGNQGSGTPAGKAEAGRAEAARRFPKNDNS